MARGTNIASVDYNTIRSGIVSILSTGFGQNGYGQKLYSMPVSPGEIVTEEQWDSLRIDITNAKLHQDGVTPSIVNVSKGQVIQFGVGHPNNSYSSIINQSTLAKFNIAPGRTLVTPVNTVSRTGSWNTQIHATLTVTFNGGYTVTNRDLTSFTATGADHARHFFNSGGKIRINSTRIGGTNTAQNNSWSNLLSTIGTLEFGAITPTAINFYTLTNTYQTVFQSNAMAPYSNNFFRLEAKCNCSEANNATGTANVIDFRMVWGDAFIDMIPPFDDNVDGLFTLTVNESKAAGELIQGGNFTIISPLYNLSPITIDESVPSTPMYALVPDKTTVDEGDTVTFIVYTQSVANGTILYWTTTSILGTVNASDFTDNVTSGTVIINNNTGIISRTLRNDLVTEGTEKFLIQLKTGSISGPDVAASPIVTVNNTSSLPAGEQIFTNTTADVSWVVPANVESITVTGAGGGGGGGGADGGSNFKGYGAGGGGSNLITRTYAVTPGQVLSVRVGSGGAGGAGGGNKGGGQTGGAGAASTVTGTGVSFVSAGGSGGGGGGNGGSGFTGLGANGANYLTSFKAGFGGGASANGVLGGTSTNGGSNGGAGSAVFKVGGQAGQPGSLKISWGQ